MSRWFRSYIGTARDPKFVGVAVTAGQSVERVLFIWQCLLESAAEKAADGIFIVDRNEIAYFLRCDTKDYDAVLDAMREAALIDGNQIVKWNDRQFLPPKDATNAVRQARYREKHNTRNADTQESNAVTNGAPSVSVSVSGSDQSESRKRALPRARVDELFERFMKVFPKRVNLKAARARFETALKAGVDPEKIIARAVVYAEETKFTERQYIKAPDKWLSAGKYDDELPTEPQQAPPARAGPNGHRPRTMTELASMEFSDEPSASPPEQPKSSEPAEPTVLGFAGRLSQPDRDQPGGKLLDLGQAGARWRA